MANTPLTYRLLTYLRQRGVLGPLRRVMDIGAQDMRCSGCEAELGEFIKTFAPTARFSFDDLSDASYGSAHALFKLIYCEYENLDVVNHPFEGIHSQGFDLNFDRVPDSIKETYDLVINTGSTDHVFDQLNSFEVIHDLSAIGGVMIHFFAVLSVYDGLYFLSQRALFSHIAQANDYEMLGMWITQSPSRDLMPAPDSEGSWESLRLHLDENGLRPNEQGSPPYLMLAYVVAMRKTASRPFVVPQFSNFSDKTLGPDISTHTLELFRDLFMINREFQNVHRCLCIGSPHVYGNAPAGKWLQSSHGSLSRSQQPNPDSLAQDDFLQKIVDAAIFDSNTISAEQFLLKEYDTGDTFDVVINAGASSIVIDQKSFFEKLHSIVSIGGYFIHIVPYFGRLDNIYYAYEYTFLHELAETNGYEIITSNIQIEGDIFPYTMKVLASLDFERLRKGRIYWLIMIARKRYPHPFAIPFQALYKGIRKEGMARRYRVVREGLLIEDWPCLPQISIRHILAKREQEYVERLQNAQFPPCIDRLPSMNIPKTNHVHLDFERPIYGTGWGPCWHDENNNYFRFLGRDGTSTLYLKLEEQLDYILKVVIWCDPNPKVSETLRVAVNNMFLKRIDKGMVDEKAFFSYALPGEILRDNPRCAEVKFLVDLPEPKESFALKEILVTAKS